jgi:hypothetical protein
MVCQENSRLSKKIQALQRERDSLRLGSEVREALLKKNEELRSLVQKLFTRLKTYESSSDKVKTINEIYDIVQQPPPPLELA